jgi:CheY-like chemotaxis protein
MQNSEAAGHSGRVDRYVQRCTFGEGQGGHMAKNKPRVLVVDDDELILALLVDAFEDAGFDVATAANAIDAHTVLEGSGHVDLVVTDIKMPGKVDGLVFGHVVADLHPEIPIIVVSGVTQPDDRDLPPGATFVPKPFKLALLLDEAKLLVDNARARAVAIS